MKRLVFSTGNTNKFEVAKLICERKGIELLQRVLDIDEIQSEDAERIIIDKAVKAFALLKKPVVVSDDCWEIPGLNGFPGPYMKSINGWFTPEDLLRLTLPLANRRVYLTQRIAYKDFDSQKTFQIKTKGMIQKEVRGKQSYPNQKLMSMDGDNGLTIAEVYDRYSNPERTNRDVAQIWHQFTDWYNAKLH